MPARCQLWRLRVSQVVTVMQKHCGDGTAENGLCSPGGADAAEEIAASSWCCSRRY